MLFYFDQNPDEESFRLTAKGSLRAKTLYAAFRLNERPEGLDAYSVDREPTEKGGWLYTIKLTGIRQTLLPHYPGRWRRDHLQK